MMNFLRNYLRGAQFVSLVLIALFFCAASAPAQKKQAVVILRAPGGAASVAACDGATELNYQLLTDFKLNDKEEVRLAGGMAEAGETALVSRKGYEDTGKAKLRDLHAVKWNASGVLSAVSVEGQTPTPALPDNLKPQKNSDQPLSSFYAVMLTGEARDGKQKRKVSLPLRDIFKIYFVPENAAVNDTLFKHAAEEKSVALWDAFFKRTNNYRLAEANSLIRDALIGCARADLDVFRQGSYGALDQARQRAERAQSVRGDETTRQLLADINAAQQRVDAVRAQVEQLSRANKHDEAIDAAEPIKMYLTSWPDLNTMYTAALERSHQLHLFKGEEALRNNQLDAALNECSLAWKRTPGSMVARDCVCQSRNRVAVRDAKDARQRKRPKDAKELLEKQLADADCRRDETVAKELAVSKCEYAQQLLTEARQLVGGSGGAPRPRPPAKRTTRSRGALSHSAQSPQPLAGAKLITALNKKDFRDARDKLILASELCPDEPIRALLEASNRSLSNYCLAEARKSIQRGDFGTAYVYLQTAQGYTPSEQSVLELLSQARSEFEERTRVSVGVVLADKSGSRYALHVLNDLSAALESAATEAGLSQPVVLERSQAARALQAIQSGRQLNSPTVIFYGDLLAAHVRSSAPSRHVSSTYSYDNPERRRWDRAIDEKKALYENCKKRSGEASCTGYQNEIERMRAHRNTLPRQLERSYSYVATAIRVQGDLRLAFRATDSVSRSAQTVETLGANVNYNCEQHEGVHEDDRSYVRNNFCDRRDDGAYVADMGAKVKGDALLQARAQLRGLPVSYYKRARSGANRQQAVEDYLRFLFLTRDKDGGEAQEAKQALLAVDPELKTDGVLR